MRKGMSNELVSVEGEKRRGEEKTCELELELYSNE
jgi:hypothetical protein